MSARKTLDVLNGAPYAVRASGFDGRHPGRDVAPPWSWRLAHLARVPSRGPVIFRRLGRQPTSGACNGVDATPRDGVR